jgi:hypothetical protein
VETGTMAADPDVRLLSVEWPAPVPELGAVQEKCALVKFSIKWGNLGLSFPVLIEVDRFDNAEIVTAARHYLHTTLSSLANRTKAWEQPKEWIDREPRRQP